MSHLFLRTGAVVALAGLWFAISGCRESPASPQRPLTEDERATIGETARHLYRESSQAFASDLGSFAAQGELFELTSLEEGVQMCRAIRQNRVSAREEIVDERVEVVSRDAAVLITRGVYTVQRRDGRTTVRPQVVTTVWARQDGEWRRVHLHESWQAGRSASPPEANQ